MDNSEEMDLDSLMELLDDKDPFEEEMGAKQATNNTTENNIVPTVNNIVTTENNIVATESISTRPARLQLKDMFREDFLTPKVVENPKKDTSFNKPSHKMFPLKDSVVHSGETDSSDEESKEYLTKTGQNIKKVVEQKLSLSNLLSKPTKPSISTWTNKVRSKSDSSSNGMEKESSFIVDSYSGIRIINPLVSFSTLQQRMDGRRMIKMSFIRNFVKNGDIEGDWVTMGVIIQKIPPKTSANGKTYSIWKMSDLHDVEKPISVFLFKTAHSELWKTTVGTVIGILNPSIMPKRDNNGDLCIAVDQPGKCMIMGKSKDLGFCKSKRKDGASCNVAVNMFQCEYCTFHIKKEYRKFSSSRSEIQSSFSGREPTLKNKILKGQNVFYGGQSFSAGVEKKSSAKLKTKDKLTLSNLGLKRKAEALESDEKGKSVKKLSDLYGPDILKVAEKNSEFINEKLSIPTAGSRNLLQHIMKEKVKPDEQVVKVITPKEQLKLYQSRMNVNSGNKQKDQVTLRNLMPQIGRGLLPGQQVNLDFSSPKRNNASDIAKLKAIQLIKEKGPLKNKDPNSTKGSEESADKVKAVLGRCFEEKKGDLETKTAKSSVVTTQLGTLDMNSEKVKEILKRKSSHMYEVEMAEMEKEAAYFNALEKKEKMEEKMASTLEIVCDVVSCKKCKYTAHSAADKCKSEQHPLKCHKAVKRFFACKDCKHRTFAFTKLPNHVCRVCKGSSFERTSMMKARKGPKLDTETLNIRGEEEMFLDSQCSINF